MATLGHVHLVVYNGSDERQSLRSSLRDGPCATLRTDKSAINANRSLKDVEKRRRGNEKTFRME